MGTLADICFAATLETICATLSHADFVKDFDTKYPNLKPYLKRLAAAIPNYASVNGEGAAALRLDRTHRQEQNVNLNLIHQNIISEISTLFNFVRFLLTYKPWYKYKICPYFLAQR